ncbi:ABC-2 type transporter, partial [mine drainage metagenome]
MVVQGVLLVFVWILDPSLLPVAFLGAILFSMFTMGQRVLNEAAYLRIDHKANDLYLASPITPEGYFLGMALGILAVYVGPVLVIGLLSIRVVPYTPAIAALMVLLAAGVWLFSASTGYIFSTFFRDNRAIWAYSSLFFNLFGVLFPVFYPPDPLPGRPPGDRPGPSSERRRRAPPIVDRGDRTLVRGDRAGRDVPRRRSGPDPLRRDPLGPADLPGGVTVATRTLAVGGEPPPQGRSLPAFAIIGWRWIGRNPAVAV